MPNQSEFEIFTEEDKRSFAYRLCVLGHVGIGAAMGSLAGGMTIPGAIGGGLWGLGTCKFLAVPIQRKLFSSAKLSDGEFRQALQSVKQQHPGIRKADALKLIAKARMESSGGRC